MTERKIRKAFIAIVAVLAMACTVLAGCGQRALQNRLNCGYEFANAQAEEITFRIYHTNGGYSWEEVANFTSNPEEGLYYDVVAEGAEGIVNLSVQARTCKEDGDGYSYGNPKILGEYSLPLERFEGFLCTKKIYQVYEKEGEQLMYLYPVAKHGGDGYLPGSDPDPDMQYGDMGNLDDILVTVTIR